MTCTYPGCNQPSVGDFLTCRHHTQVRLCDECDRQTPGSSHQKCTTHTVLCKDCGAPVNDGKCWCFCSQKENGPCSDRHCTHLKCEDCNKRHVGGVNEICEECKMVRKHMQEEKELREREKKKKQAMEEKKVRRDTQNRLQGLKKRARINQLRERGIPKIKAERKQLEASLQEKRSELEKVHSEYLALIERKKAEYTEKMKECQDFENKIHELNRFIEHYA